MSSTHQASLSSEWSLLQQYYYRYEQQALLIKLTATVVTSVALLIAPEVFVVAIILVLWLQEGIVRTWQSRLGDRSLKLEASLRSADPDLPAWQLHSEWQATRPSLAEMMQSYLVHALRPTVMLPYAVLVAIAVTVIGVP